MRSPVSVFAPVCFVLLAGAPSHPGAETRHPVDVELVIAADVSGSMGRHSSAGQRAAFASAFREPLLREAILSGPYGRIAVTYVEWAGEDHQVVVVPWRMIDDDGDMAALAEELTAAPAGGVGGATSISAALLFARDEILANDYISLKAVIDVSGDGENNSGPSMARAAEAMRAAGMTVNGLVLAEGLALGPYDTSPGSLDVAAYYRQEVRQGTGSFVVRVEEEGALVEAVLRKLVLEVAWLR